MLGLSTAKVTQAAMNGTSSNQTSAEAAQIAQSDAELLRSVSYQDVAPSSRKAVEGTPFQHEMTVSSESDFNSSVKQKTVTIKVFKGAETNPRSELRFTRYSAESTSSSVPQGSIIPWYGSPGNIPNGFALCDGKNGTPDLRDRFLVGAGKSYKLSNTGGENTHVLTIAEMPKHEHTIYSGRYGSNIYSISCDGSSYGGILDHKHLTQPAGGNQPHENRPPYYALHYIMKL